jgi:4-amino-4-deoxy-L-arabinose transferase-like glycosyltransferase
MVPTLPVSDFHLMYITGADVAKGNYYAFHDYAYFARFTHNTVTVLYFSLFYKLSSSPLFLIKLGNVFFQTAAVYGLYLAVKELLGEKKAIVSAFILAVFPPFIIYTSETMSENMAMPFYIFAVYLFLAVTKGSKSKWFLLLCGIAVSIGNMFRMVGIVFIIAFIMYNLIYKKIKKGTAASALILAGFLLTTFLVSQALIASGITENHLWKPKESSITSILRGTNLETGGRWNTKDADVPGSVNNDPEKVKEVAGAIIKERLTTTPLPRLIFHYLQKLIMQWSKGDFNATGWTLYEVSNTPLANSIKYISYEISLAGQLFYLVILYRAFTAIKRRQYMNITEFNFLYILFGGFILMLLITEFQERYAFIAAWLFPILAAKAPAKDLN